MFVSSTHTLRRLDDTPCPRPEREVLCTLHVKSRIDLDPRTCHTRVLRQHDERIRAVLEIRLMLERRRILRPLNLLIRVPPTLRPRVSLLSYQPSTRPSRRTREGGKKTYPLCQQQPRQYSVDAYLGALRRTEALDELQLRCLCHGVGRGAGLGDGGDGAAADEGAAVGVGFESWLGGFEKGEGHFDVGDPALGLLVTIRPRRMASCGCEKKSSNE
jgi:hypothetical protein